MPTGAVQSKDIDVARIYMSMVHDALDRISTVRVPTLVINTALDMKGQCGDHGHPPRSEKGQCEPCPFNTRCGTA